MARAIKKIGASTTEQPLLNQKAELATKAVDMLLFSGQVGSMVTSMASMFGISQVSVSLIFPTKKPANMRPFLASLSSITSTALDEQVGLDEFTRVLAENIKVIQSIVAEEK